MKSTTTFKESILIKIATASSFAILSLIAIGCEVTEEEPTKIDPSLVYGVWNLQGTTTDYVFQPNGGFEWWVDGVQMENDLWSTGINKIKVQFTPTFSDGLISYVNNEFTDVKFSNSNSIITAEYWIEDCNSRESCKGGELVSQGTVVLVKE